MLKKYETNLMELTNSTQIFNFLCELPQLFEYEYGQCPNNLTMEYEQKTIVDDRYIKYQLEQEIASIDALINEF